MISSFKSARSKGSYSQVYGFATITMYSWWQFGELACRSEIIFFQGRVEAGRAHHCSSKARLRPTSFRQNATNRPYIIFYII